MKELPIDPMEIYLADHVVCKKACRLMNKQNFIVCHDVEFQSLISCPSKPKRFWHLRRRILTCILDKPMIYFSGIPREGCLLLFWTNPSIMSFQHPYPLRFSSSSPSPHEWAIRKMYNVTKSMLIQLYLVDWAWVLNTKQVLILIFHSHHWLELDIHLHYTFLKGLVIHYFHGLLFIEKIEHLIRGIGSKW